MTKNEMEHAAIAALGREITVWLKADIRGHVASLHNLSVTATRDVRKGKVLIGYTMRWRLHGDRISNTAAEMLLNAYPQAE